jgi:twinfilin-like protein
MARSPKKDLDEIQDWFQPKSPCFVLFYLASPSDDSGSIAITKKEKSWMVLQYIPDDAPVKSKMLYASSKQTLLKELGDSNFAYTVSGSTKVCYL